MELKSTVNLLKIKGAQIGRNISCHNRIQVTQIKIGRIFSRAKRRHTHYKYFKPYQSNPTSSRKQSFQTNEMKDSSSKRVKIEKKSAAELGSDPVFSEPHEDSNFEMSKEISGETGSVEKTSEKKKKKRKRKKKKDERENEVEREGRGDFWSKYPNIGESFEDMKVNFPSLNMSSMMKKKLSWIGDEKAKEFDEKWKQLAVDKIELDYKMLRLMKDQFEYAFNHY